MADHDLPTVRKAIGTGLALFAAACALTIIGVTGFAPRVSGSAPVGQDCSEDQVRQTGRVLVSTRGWRPATLVILRREIEERRMTLTAALRTKLRLELASAFDRPRVARVFCSTAWTRQGGEPIATLPAIAARLRAVGAPDIDAWFIATCLAVEARPLPAPLQASDVGVLKGRCLARSRNWDRLYR